MRGRTAPGARCRAALACGVFALGLGAAQADEGDDPFARIAPSIARLNFSGFRTMGYCTAVQAGRRAALVAGDCLKAGSFDQIHLLFGYDRQVWAAHRVGKAAFNDPARSDLKLLCLDGDLPAPRLDLSAEPVMEGERVIVAGYAMPSPHKVTFKGCGVAQAQGVSSFILGCGLAVGNAGAAVFELRADAVRLLGVTVAGNDDAAVVLRWTGESPDKLCPPESTNETSESNG